MTSQQSLGRQLRHYRRARDVSQEELAGEVGLANKSSISKRESGAQSMSRSELLELCAAVERIVEKRSEKIAPAEVLGE